MPHPELSNGVENVVETRWVKAIEQLNGQLAAIRNAVADGADLSRAQAQVKAVCDQITHASNGVGKEPGNLLGQHWDENGTVVKGAFDALPWKAGLTERQAQRLHKAFLALVEFLMEGSNDYDRRELAGKVSKTTNSYLQEGASSVQELAAPVSSSEVTGHNSQADVPAVHGDLGAPSDNQLWEFEPGLFKFRNKPYDLTHSPRLLLTEFVTSTRASFGNADLKRVLQDDMLEQGTLKSHLSALRAVLRMVANEFGMNADCCKVPIPHKSGGWRFLLPRSDGNVR